MISNDFNICPENRTLGANGEQALAQELAHKRPSEGPTQTPIVSNPRMIINEDSNKQVLFTPIKQDSQKSAGPTDVKTGTTNFEDNHKQAQDMNKIQDDQLIISEMSSLKQS